MTSNCYILSVLIISIVANNYICITFSYVDQKWMPDRFKWANILKQTNASQVNVQGAIALTN